MTLPIISHPRKGIPNASADLVVVGGGAAGLATAIFAARHSLHPARSGSDGLRIIILDGARSLGAKILVSGGSRCNVTNTHVDAADFWLPGSSFVKQVLRALPVTETIAFFAEIGVDLKEEPLGKLFPITNKSRTVLEALLAETLRLGIEIHTSRRVSGLRPGAGGWTVETTAGPVEARQVALATGGLSLPKTGSDGFGYTLAAGLGHTIVPTVPALEPLSLEGDFHPPLSGISHEAALRIARPGEKAVVITGSLLWTHFGISGPLALNASRFWRRAKAAGATASLSLSFVPGVSAEALDERLVIAARERPHQNVVTELAHGFGLVQAVAVRLLSGVSLAGVVLGKLTREQRRALVRALTAFPLDVVDGRGYNFAEVTSGGVALEEINPKTMESRLSPGLYLVGEILDVDGRIGGFNFQWAWSTGKVAGRAVATKALDLLPKLQSPRDQ